MSERLAEDLGNPQGDKTCVSKYLLYRCLERAISLHISTLFEKYNLEYVQSIITDPEKALECKEEIDDYLGDVQYRVVDRLDQVREVKRMQAYFKMDVGDLIDKINSLSVDSKINLILKKQLC